VKENLAYLFWAYTVIWLFVAVYLGVLMAKQRSLRRQIDEIRSKLEGRTSSGS
jgi:CcmD family protein